MKRAGNRKTVHKMPAEVSLEDVLRADVYRLLAVLLRAGPDEENLAMLATMRGDDTRLGKAVASLAMLAKKTTSAQVDIEYHALFIGTDVGELEPYGSTYIQTASQQKTLDQLKDDMNRVGISMRTDIKEPEDHIAALCEMMAGMILGEFSHPVSLAVSLEEQKEFFRTHMQPWAKAFFTDLQLARSSVFYTGVGAIGTAFMDIEVSAFEML